LEYGESNLLNGTSSNEIVYSAFAAAFVVNEWHGSGIGGITAVSTVLPWEWV